MIGVFHDSDCLPFNQFTTATTVDTKHLLVVTCAIELIFVSVEAIRKQVLQAGYQKKILKIILVKLKESNFRYCKQIFQLGGEGRLVRSLHTFPKFETTFRPVTKHIL